MKTRRGAVLALAMSIPTAGADVLPERAEALLNLLRHDCGSCHGIRLEGGLGPALTPQAVAAKPAEALAHVILEGRPGTAMPPWQSLLSREDARWLVETLRAGTAAPGTHTP